jgi:ABC-type phosphate transport system substrate-binding protein
MSWKRSVTAACALAGAVLVVLAGCASALSTDSARVRAPAGVTLPLATRVTVELDPTMPDTQTVEFRGASWQYPDAELMREAALRVFGQVFQEVGTPPAMTAPIVTLQVSGSSSLNPVMNEYYANATVRVFPSASTYAQPIASFAGTGQASQPDFVDDGIAQAYAGAFRQIADLLLADPQFIASLRGY